MNQSILRPTKGPFWVEPVLSNELPGHLRIVSQATPVIAIIPPKADGSPNWVDAGLLSSSAHALEALCKIQMMVRGHQASATEIDQIVSDVFEKMQIEAEA